MELLKAQIVKRLHTVPDLGSRKLGHIWEGPIRNSRIGPFFLDKERIGQEIPHVFSYPEHPKWRVDDGEVTAMMELTSGITQPPGQSKNPSGTLIVSDELARLVSCSFVASVSNTLFGNLGEES